MADSPLPVWYVPHDLFLIDNNNNNRYDNIERKTMQHYVVDRKALSPRNIQVNLFTQVPTCLFETEKIINSYFFHIYMKRGL